jgi:hypothetical protein
MSNWYLGEHIHIEYRYKLPVGVETKRVGDYHWEITSLPERIEAEKLADAAFHAWKSNPNEATILAVIDAFQNIPKEN